MISKRRRHILKYDCIAWDWNGTILNDIDAAIGAVNIMLDNRGLDRITLKQYYSYMDTPIIKFYEHILDLEKENFADISKEYNMYYNTLLKGDEVSEDTVECLEQIKAKGINQIILSSFECNKLTELLKEYKIYDYFSAVLGAGDFAAGSKTERAISYIKEKGFSPEKTVIIGDMLHDAEVANEVGCDCILVKGGHHNEEILSATGYPIVDSIPDAMKLII